MVMQTHSAFTGYNDECDDKSIPSSSSSRTRKTVKRSESTKANARKESGSNQAVMDDIVRWAAKKHLPFSICDCYEAFKYLGKVRTEALCTMLLNEGRIECVEAGVTLSKFRLASQARNVIIMSSTLTSSADSTENLIQHASRRDESAVAPVPTVEQAVLAKGQRKHREALSPARTQQSAATVIKKRRAAGRSLTQETCTRLDAEEVLLWARRWQRAFNRYTCHASLASLTEQRIADACVLLVQQGQLRQVTSASDRVQVYVLAGHVLAVAGRKERIEDSSDDSGEEAELFGDFSFHLPAHCARRRQAAAVTVSAAAHLLPSCGVSSAALKQSPHRCRYAAPPAGKNRRASSATVVSGRQQVTVSRTECVQLDARDVLQWARRQQRHGHAALAPFNVYRYEELPHITRQRFQQACEHLVGQGQMRVLSPGRLSTYALAEQLEDSEDEGREGPGDSDTSGPEGC
jgi:hypothetical protein